MWAGVSSMISVAGSEAARSFADNVCASCTGGSDGLSGKIGHLVPTAVAANGVELGNVRGA